MRSGPCRSRAAFRHHLVHAVDFLPLPFLERDIELVERPDGAVLLRSRVPLGPVEPHLSAVLRRHAQARAAHPWLVQRSAVDGAWTELTYGEASDQADRVAQWLLDLDRPGRRVMVLSGNSAEHAVFEMAAMLARMPYVPVTPAYALLSGDHAKLRGMVGRMQPAVVFVQSGRAFERALRALDLDADVRVVWVSDPPETLRGHAWPELLATPARGDVDASLAGVTHGTVAKILFTSGSTGEPKAVPLTQGMLCATMAMHAMTVRRAADTPAAVLLEWLPWSHVAGGTAIFNSVL